MYNNSVNITLQNLGEIMFSKKTEKRCIYCERSVKIDDNNSICIKHGVVSNGYNCKSYRYNPLKRVPPAKAVLNAGKYSAQDFTV